MTDKSDHDLLVSLHTTLLGQNGEDGFIGEVRRQNAENSKAIEALYDKHSALSQKFYWLIGLLAGAGILTGSIIGIN